MKKWQGRCVVRTMIAAIVIQAVCGPAGAAQLCYYYTHKFSEGAKLSVACATTKGTPLVCTVLVCTAGAWVKHGQAQCSRDGCPPAVPTR